MLFFCSSHLGIVLQNEYIKNEKFRTVKCSDNIFVRNFYRPKFFVSEIFRCPEFFDSYNFVRNTFGSKPSYLIPFFAPCPYLGTSRNLNVLQITSIGLISQPLG